MKLNTIANQQAASITTCDAEPIHIPGAIQSHGALLACDNTSLLVAFCSQNLPDWVGQQPQQLLGKPLAALDETLALLCRRFIDGEFPANTEHTFTIQGKVVNVILHSSDTYIILELTQAVIERLTAQQTFQLVNDFGKIIDRATGLVHLSQLIAAQIKALSGYDRVMIYRFDKSYNGVVIAESKADGLEPYLNLHYPHTDIPAQARALYTKQLVRVIPDVSFVPVPIVTLKTADHTALDLSNSHLRSVSPIHIQYLKNMQVGATLTISLLLEGKLWGLIACHHRTPFLIDESRKQAALMLGQLLTSQIRVQENAEEYAVHLEVDAYLQRLLGSLNIHEEFELQFQQLTPLNAVAGAAGVAILKDGELYTKGKTPSYDKIRQLIKWLSKTISTNQYCTDSLIKKYPAAGEINTVAAGILYCALGEPDKQCIIWFRPEIEQTIQWAGNPGLDDGKKKENELQPRTSFAIWKETVKHCSASWKQAEINAAAQFASALRNQFHLQQVQAEQTRQQILNEQLRIANNELSNINWIVSHDLKEPIRKIQLFSSKLMKDEGEDVSATVTNAIGKIQHSAARMNTLVHDILSYSIIGEGNNTAKQPVSLNEVIAEILAERKDDIEALEAGLLPVVVTKTSQMRQLFSNLIGNSIKYVRPGEKARISITSAVVSDWPATLALTPGKNYHRIVVQDQGLGFENENNEKIFDIFVRLHHSTEYEGTGIGLAICKKISAMNGGAITAEGSPHEGAIFTIYLPAD